MAQHGEQMSITFLGTSASWPTAERNVSAIALRRGGEIVLFDCGEGTQRQLQRSGLSYMEISRVCLTHHHGDHCYGLPGLLKTMQLNERDKPLEILGPPGTHRVVEAMMRIAPIRHGFDLRVREPKPGEAVEGPGYVLRAATGIHGMRNYAWCLEEAARPGRFDKPKALELGVPEGPLFRRLQLGQDVTLKDGRTVRSSEVVGPPRRGRKVVVSGDTRPSDRVVELARGADVLIHEATFLSDLQANAEEHGHSTAREAADVARRAEVGRLVLTHFSPRYTDTGPFLEEARAVFPNVEAAVDFTRLEVAFP